MNVQEQSSTFSKTTKKSVQVIQSGSIDEHNSQDLSSSTSASSLASDSTLRDMSVGRLDDFVFRPTILNFDSMMGITGNEFEDCTRDVCKTNEGKTFEMSLNVQDYRPDEIKVKVSDNLVTVSAKQEQRSESSSSSKSFSKKFSLPSGVKPDSIVCNLSTQGVLKVTAPITQTHQSINSGTEQSVKQQQHKQVSQTQQESTSSTRKSSLNSDVSSLRDFDEFIVRPRHIDLNSLISNTNSEVSRELCNITEGKKFEVKIEVKNFKAEEVQVKITKSVIKIEGKHESQFASRSFYKEQTIPYGVKANEITCTMSDDGILTLSAPIHQQPQTSSINQRTSEQVNSSTNVQQQQQQQQSVHKKLQETGRTDSNTSTSTSTSKRLEDMILRPITNFDLESILSQRGSLFEDVSKQIRQVDVNDVKKFEMKLDVPDYKPEEIQVKIANNMVIIEAKQTTENSSRQFYKKFSIPAGVKPENITSRLSPSGVLTLEAPIERTTSEQQQISQTQQTQSQSVRKEQQAQQQQHSDSNTSISSNLSSISSKLDRDFVLRPIMDFNALMAKDSRFEDISKQICQVSDNKKFETKIEVAGYQPNELEVKISNNMVTISGKQEMRQENNFSSKSFNKAFSIPAGVKPESITSSLSPGGVLTLSAPIDLNNQAQQQQLSGNKTVTSTTSSVTRSEQVVSGNRNDGGRQVILKPKINLDNSITSVHSSFDDISKDLYHVCDGQNFEMKLPVEGYKPEEIDVRISNNLVTIEGKQEMRQENNFSSKSFSKKFTLPSTVRVETIVCTFNTNGFLTITGDQRGDQQQQLVESQQNQQVSQTSQTVKKVSQTFSSTQSSSTQQQQQQLSSSTQQQLK